MSARVTPPRRPKNRAESRALAEALVRHAPCGDVRAAEALAATALNRRRRAVRLWNGAFAEAAPDFAAIFAVLPVQAAAGRADPRWNAICRRIAARAAAGAGPDPANGAHYALPSAAPAGPAAPAPVAVIGPFAFYRERA